MILIRQQQDKQQMLKLKSKRNSKKQSNLVPASPSTDREVSFNSLTKIRKGQIYQSQMGPSSQSSLKKTPMLYSQLTERTDSCNKENVKQEYLLFTNMLRSKRVEEKKQTRPEYNHKTPTKQKTERKNPFSKVRSEYFMNTIKTANPPELRKRSNSKQIMERYLQGTTSVIKCRKQLDYTKPIIKEQQQSSITIISQDLVNQSGEMIEFNMSPYLS